MVLLIFRNILPKKVPLKCVTFLLILASIITIRCETEEEELELTTTTVSSSSPLPEEEVESCSINKKESCPSITKDRNQTDSEESSNNWTMAQSHYVTTLAGVRMPKLIYGTAWKKERTTHLVVQAVQQGFRGIDTACQPKHYYEPGVGAALKIIKESLGINREDLFVQTKYTSVDGQDQKSIPYNPKDELPVTVKQSLEVSLKNLGTTYIDSLVMHSPMRTHRDTMEVWRVFESFVDEGKVKQLGISNCYSLSNFQKIYDEARVKPAVLQNRLYAETGFDKELRDFCKEKGIYYQSFWTLTANPQILSNSRVQQIAQKFQKTTSQIFFAYLIQTNVVTPLTGTTNPVHMKQDLETLDMTLSADEMGVFDSLINN